MYKAYIVKFYQLIQDDKYELSNNLNDKN